MVWQFNIFNLLSNKNVKEDQTEFKKKMEKFTDKIKEKTKNLKSSIENSNQDIKNLNISNSQVNEKLKCLGKNKALLLVDGWFYKSVYIKRYTIRNASH